MNIVYIFLLEYIFCPLNIKINQIQQITSYKNTRNP